MKKIMLVIVGMLAILSLVACKNEKQETASSETKSNKLVVYCPHPLEFINPVVTKFENETGIKVEVVAAGTGELLKRIEAEANNPLGDILWGGSLSTLQPKKDLFENYLSVNENEVYDEYKNTDGSITRFSAIPSVIMVNTKLIGDIKVEGYEDLLNPALKGKIANADPSKSSSSLEHVINQLYAMGKGNPDAGWSYIEKFIPNLDGKLLSGSSAVYKGVADGEYTVGLTFEEAAYNYLKSGAPIEIVYPKEGTITKPDGVVIVKNAKNMENAKKFIDFVTSKTTQELVAKELNRRSVRKDVPAAEGLKEMSSIYSIKDDPKWSNDNKQNMLNKYKELVIK